METEVKLAFDSPDRLWEILDSDWFMNFCLDNEPKKPVTLVNTYYDTRDRKLSSRGGMIRIRLYKSGDNEDSYEHTVKYGGKVDNGLHQRYEWNVKADSKNFDVAEFKRNAYNEDDPNELLDEILEGVKEEDLIPLCSNEFKRTVYTFGYGDSIMEACFDEGVIESSDGKTENITELELELSSGDVVDLKDLADFIVEHTGAQPFNESKFQRSLKMMDSNGDTN